MTEAEESHEEDNYVGEEVARIKCPYEHNEQNLIGLRQSGILVEEKRSLKLIHLVCELDEEGHASNHIHKILEPGIRYLDTVLSDVDIWVRHQHHQVITHVLDLYSHPTAHTRVPLLLHSRLHDFVDVPLVDLETQIEG